MRIRVITSPEAIAGETDQLNALFAEGLHCLHLRKPDWPEWVMASLLDNVLPLYRSRIVLHSHFNLAAKYLVKGVHFPESSRLALSEKELKRLLEQWHEKGKTVSTSAHHPQTLLDLSPAFDEVLVSPVFESISKAGYQPAENWDVRECKKQLGFTLIGLGGIEESRLVEAAKLGFGEVAVLGAIWQKPERGVETFRRLREQGDLIEEELYRMGN